MTSIGIVSGKGGTGKTTLTALFAHLAAAEGRLVLADADVEASNLPLALSADDGVCESFQGGYKAEILPELCAACGLCERTCSVGAVVHTSDYGYAIDPLACDGCGACERACQADAIRLVTGTAGQACDAESAVGPIAYGRLTPGEDLSGKLVTHIRDRAKAAAERTSADLVLVDGPPGIGCPAIAAIADTDHLVAVAEPTVSGAHDLERLLSLADRFDLTVSVLLNKSDLSEEGSSQIRKVCSERGIALLGTIPFDEGVPSALSRLAQGALIGDLSPEVPALMEVAAAWTAVRAAVGLPR